MESFDQRLQGFSGCPLVVFRSAGTTRVRKIAASVNRNHRIDAELAKLQVLKLISRQTTLFRVPEIYGDGVDDHGRRYYEMQFIVGQSLESLIEDLNPMEISKWADRIAEITQYFEQSCPAACAGEFAATESEGCFLVAKLVETLEYLRGQVNSTSAHRQLVDEFEDLTEALRREIIQHSAPPSFSHGDLAMDNILIDRHGEIYLIDPLHSGYETVLWDVAKVLQSCHLHWSQVKAGNFILESDGAGVIICPSYKLGEFERRFMDHVADMRRTTLYLGITIARIVKYARDQRQTAALLILTNRLLRRYLTQEGLVHEPARTVRW